MMRKISTFIRLWKLKRAAQRIGRSTEAWMSSLEPSIQVMRANISSISASYDSKAIKETSESLLEIVALVNLADTRRKSGLSANYKNISHLHQLIEVLEKSYVTLVTLVEQEERSHGFADNYAKNDPTFKEIQPAFKSFILTKTSDLMQEKVA